MKNWIETDRKAVRASLETRKRAGISKYSPICVYDLAERLGVEVRFVGGKNFEGMFSKTSQTILVPTLRPSGRQAFACGHELGHWYFEHGSHIDDTGTLAITSTHPEERIANIYASYLLMPKWTVEEALHKRGWKPANCSPLQIYIIACQIGVGYETLISQLQFSLRLISSAHADVLRKVTPKQIRQLVLGKDAPGHLVIVDHLWAAVPIDLQVDDIAVVPEGVYIEGYSVTKMGETKQGLLIKACKPGIARAELGDRSWAAFIRVSRKGFEGRSIYRHLEDPDVDHDA